jgi:hypothetical protein
MKPPTQPSAPWLWGAERKLKERNSIGPCDSQNDPHIGEGYFNKLLGAMGRIRMYAARRIRCPRCQIESNHPLKVHRT